MDMLDFIWKGSAELYGARNKGKIQNDNICLRREWNQRTLAFQPDTLDRLAIGSDDLFPNEKYFTLLQNSLLYYRTLYFTTENFITWKVFFLQK